MNKIHKLVACLVRPYLLHKVLVAMAITVVPLYLYKPSDEELRSIFVIIKYSAVATLPCAWIFMKIFYADRFDSYWPNGTGWHFRYLSYDPYFYQAITSESSLICIVTGYVYAISKIVGGYGMGFALAVGAYMSSDFLIQKYYP